jgi:hypothetical protein
MQAQDDRRNVTPPEIDELFNSIRSKIPQRSDTDQLVNRSNPKLYVIHSHGSSLDKKFDVKVPIVCGVKDGESHERVTASRMEDALERTVNSSMVDIMKRNIETVQYEAKIMKQNGIPLVDQVLEAAKMLPVYGITRSLPEKYKIGQQLEDIKLFCRGTAMHDGIYAIDLVTYEIQPVARVFGLDVISEAKRNPSTPLKISHTPRYHDILWKEYDKIIALKNQLQTKKEVSEEEYGEYARRVKTYNNMILSAKGVRKLSRIAISPKSCISLSGLIRTGIDKGIIVPTKDCFIVFACRKHHNEPPPAPFKRAPSHQPSYEEHASKRRQLLGGRTRKLNKKTRRVKMRMNKTKTKTKTKNRKRKI